MTANKIALVTGANQGIGFATVESLLNEGMIVVLSARDEQKAIEAKEKINHPNCYVHKLDVTNNNSIDKTKEFIESKFKKLDILINNAAINYDTWHNSVNADLNEIEQTIDTNLMGVWRVTQTMIPLLQKSNNGRIINISSGGGSLSAQTGNTPGYSITKLALNGLTMQLANDLRKDNIFVNALCPGWVRTSMGGIAAPRSAKSASEGIVWLALTNEIHTGKFFRDKKTISW